MEAVRRSSSLLTAWGPRSPGAPPGARSPGGSVLPLGAPFWGPALLGPRSPGGSASWGPLSWGSVLPWGPLSWGLRSPGGSALLGACSPGGSILWGLRSPGAPTGPLILYPCWMLMICYCWPVSAPSVEGISVTDGAVIFTLNSEAVL